MRNTFAATLLEEAKKDNRIILLTGDLGFSAFENFMRELPKQYLNAGVAEQNMTGVAAGLAMEGYKPVIYSIVPFVTMRNFEQIRNDICYQNLNVKIVGVGAGFSYGPYGHTHHSLEDIGILRTLPDMTIIAPGDPTEVHLATRAMLTTNTPVYFRLGKAGEKILYNKEPRFRIGKGIILQDGSDATIVATSTLVSRALEAAALLAKKSCSVRVISMHTIKPIDAPLILESAKKTHAVITLEDHSIIGGLGSAVSEVLAESSLGTPFQRMGVPDRFTEKIGLQEYMHDQNGLSVHLIASAVIKLLFQRKPT
ncbi:MAG: hypothetical protein UV63_C0001G0066 [Microgenomates group bacterium GW2011_GWC1_43_11]|uniref:Transketolase-like pyrimidine-binding domain-containing protein n=2 Tax=Candidatus Gottesmaniibacteriota TaxID=1752720 RepID=A0A0G1IRT2_9BACT|nr:MAG: hypothetical protein UV63_C0001G0066 [Microgenomates group bacterium GW2011_GWC1_43_11]KKT39155.1 MAG: hypothetical protein UW22_C0001G0066 [Candidatus Gottesmanbacteria bacterium GW2011_GWB1_44_11c]KKT61628.1 MAG: hypothetical protein UW52_C0001G0066 [Candidatus Gottesmanbacteria bacterium GW2011_GWA1_44_24b]HCM82175.1 transketolase [Patescibacteria group bacterium]